jgi:hypothetical protein
MGDKSSVNTKSSAQDKMFSFKPQDAQPMSKNSRSKNRKSTKKIRREGEYIIKVGTKKTESSIASIKHIADKSIKTSNSINKSIGNLSIGEKLNTEPNVTHSEPQSNKNNNSEIPATTSFSQIVEIQKFDIGSKSHSKVKEIVDNSDLEITHPCEDFMAILASTLAKLDFSLSHPKLEGPIKDCKELRKLKHSYKKLASRFVRVGEIRNSVFIYSLALARKVKKVAMRRFSFNMGEFLLIYAGCLFLSIKMVVDTEKWFVEDFSTVSGIDEATVEKMELFVLDDALNFDVSIARDIYREEHLRTYKNIKRRVNKMA